MIVLRSSSSSNEPLCGLMGSFDLLRREMGEGAVGVGGWGWG